MVKYLTSEYTKKESLQVVQLEGFF